MASIIIDRHSHRAIQVCSNCKIRKKACDKTFPSCGYCTHRALVCQYTAPSLPKVEENDFGNEAPAYREFILPLKPPTTTAATEIESFQISCSNTPSLMLKNPVSDSVQPHYLPFSKLPEPLGVDRLLHDQVQSIIQATGQFIDDITVQYFKSIHPWIPVISRRRFQNRLINSSAPARADFSILLLSMCLITYHPSQDTAELIRQDSMYFTTKMLFLHVQSFISSSPNLIQAGVLISLYEYVHGKLDTAYRSITNCAEMAHAIGLDQPKSSLDPKGKESGLGDEEKNIWWAVVIYERAIFCDIMPIDQPLATTLPNRFEPLPSEASILDQNDSYARAARLPVSAVGIEDVGNFGHQAQAAYLLDRVLEIFKKTDIKAKLLELAKADKDLMALLGVLLEKAFKLKQHCCGAIAICIRALYVLHWHIIDQNSKDQEDWKPNSAAALETISKMVIDIADYYNKQCYAFDITQPLPTTFHIIQAALKHLDTDPSFEGDVMIKGYKVLRKFSDNFHDRWGMT